MIGRRRSDKLMGRLYLASFALNIMLTIVCLYCAYRFVRLTQYINTIKVLVLPPGGTAT